ncbi:hypothetical protein [Pseudomonas sp. FW300-N2F2]|uniref:hypothetical protein n=1 Tax=Pseudomonas sp. FW300-N2F2 TaxID=2751320 RepID=UPI001A927350|nr:hypothetical protein [Pseudomonas sp. FW300-N2F2]
MESIISKTIGQVTELTVITPIIEGKANDLRKVLNGIQVSPDSPIKRISSIHYARWVIFDNDSRLLFTSNFDGTWEKYLRDFVELAAAGLDAIWNNCVGYPGAKPYEGFATYVRSHQVETNLFYAAYPAASVPTVLKALDWAEKTTTYQRELAKPPGLGGSS